MSKITYNDKVGIEEITDYPVENQITDDDLNEIKKVVNENDDIQIQQGEDIASIKESITTINEKDTAQDEEISAIKEVNTAQDKLIAKLKGNMINLTEEGTSINVQDSSDLPSTLEVSGGVRQETSLYNGILELGSIQDGVDITANNRIRTKDFIEVKENTIVKVSGDYIEEYAVFFYNSDKQCITYSDWNELNIEIFIAPNAKYIKVVLRKKDNSNLLVDSITNFNIGPTPSPDYPSDVEAVGDNVNLFDKDNEELVTINSNGDKRYGIYLNVPNQYITVSGKFNNVISYRTIKDNAYSDYAQFNNNKTFFVEEAIVFYMGNIEEKLSTSIENLKIESGKVATSYSPYGMGSVEINKVNKNWLVLNDIEETTINGITYSLKNGILTLNGTATSGFAIKYIGEFLNIKTNNYIGSYGYISGNCTDYGGGFYLSKDKETTSNTGGGAGFRSNQGNNIGITKVTENTKFYGYIAINSNSVFNNYKISIQIELGEVATDYVSHESEIYNLPIQQPMLSGDTFVKDDGNWFEVHGWEKYVFTGNENFSVQTVKEKTTVFIKYSVFPNSINYSGFSNYFPNNADGDVEKFLVLNTNIYIGISNTIANTDEEFNQWLKDKNNEGNPVYIWYKLATPTKLPCTKEQTDVLEQLYNMPTYRPVTNVFTQKDLANLKLNYVADSKIYVDNKMSMLAEQILNK